MLYRCHQCEHFSFHAICPTCGAEAQDDNIPLDPEYYPEFQYRSRGLVKDLFVRRKIEKELHSKLDAVLRKYSEFEKPYFVNYVHLAGEDPLQGTEGDKHSKFRLFHAVLVRRGFDELEQLPQLTNKLVRLTAFRFLYVDFVKRTERHVSANLESTLQSWIDERGPVFRSHLPLLLYYLWGQKVHLDEVAFNSNALPLVDDEEMERIQERCEQIYFDILVERFQTTLEQFDPSLFVTIYALDAMSGFEFEDFLAKLFRTVGYDVQLTKRTADQGADLFVEKFGKKTVIQAKNYSENVGNAAVQQALAAKAFYSCDHAMVVTNSYFTPSAKALAEASGVALVDRRELQSYLDQYNHTILEAAAERSAKPASSGERQSE